VLLFLCGKSDIVSYLLMKATDVRDASTPFIHFYVPAPPGKSNDEDEYLSLFLSVSCVKFPRGEKTFTYIYMCTIPRKLSLFKIVCYRFIVCIAIQKTLAYK